MLSDVVAGTCPGSSPAGQPDYVGAQNSQRARQEDQLCFFCLIQMSLGPDEQNMLYSTGQRI